MFKASSITAGSIWWRYIALILGAAAALRHVFVPDEWLGLQGGGGRLTLPMDQGALIGSALLLMGAVMQLWCGRLGLVMCTAGLLLMLPFFSWVFAAGVWC